MELMELPYNAAMLLIKIYKFVTWCALHFVLPRFKAKFLKRAGEVDVIVDGPKPWHPQVHNKRVYFRAAQDKMLGLGEAYIDGWWDCDQVDELFTRMTRAGMYKELMIPTDYFVQYVQFQLFNLQTVKRCWEIAEKHYNYW